MNFTNKTVIIFTRSDDAKFDSLPEVTLTEGVGVVALTESWCIAAGLSPAE